jgi:hypothetical protein
LELTHRADQEEAAVEAEVHKVAVLHLVAVHLAVAVRHWVAAHLVAVVHHLVAVHLAVVEVQWVAVLLAVVEAHAVAAHHVEEETPVPMMTRTTLSFHLHP